MVTHPENLTSSVTQEPALQNSQGNVLTWHLWFYYQRRITFPALCISFLIESVEGKQGSNDIQEKPTIYSHPKTVANSVMEHSLSLVFEQIVYVLPNLSMMKSLHYSICYRLPRAQNINNSAADKNTGSKVKGKQRGIKHQTATNVLLRVNCNLIINTLHIAWQSEWVAHNGYNLVKAKQNKTKRAAKELKCKGKYIL